MWQYGTPGNLFRYPSTNITGRVEAWIKAFLMAKSPVSRIEQFAGCDTIRKIHEEQIDQALASYAYSQEKNGYKSRYLAIDEFAIHKMHKYAICVMDLDTDHIIWARFGNTVADFEHFFKDIPASCLDQVQAVAMNMNASYNLLVKKYLPQAEIVYDRYHMQAQNMGERYWGLCVWMLSNRIESRQYS